MSSRQRPTQENIEHVLVYGPRTVSLSYLEYVIQGPEPVGRSKVPHHPRREGQTIPLSWGAGGPWLLGPVRFRPGETMGSGPWIISSFCRERLALSTFCRAAITNMFLPMSNFGI